MKAIVTKALNNINRLKDLPPLFFRLILSYGFFGPAMKKLSNIDAIIEWFTTLGYPVPAVNAYLAAGTETLGFVLLFLGLATRLISIPLMFVMIVAITTVHLEHGFECGHNGFEVPFYYFFMLFSLLVTGAGRFSIDGLIAKKCCKGCSS